MSFFARYSTGTFLIIFMAKYSLSLRRTQRTIIKPALSPSRRAQSLCDFICRLLNSIDFKRLSHTNLHKNIYTIQASLDQMLSTSYYLTEFILNVLLENLAKHLCSLYACILVSICMLRALLLLYCILLRSSIRTILHHSCKNHTNFLGLFVVLS